MGVSAAVVFGAGEIATDAVVVPEIAALTAESVALPSVVGDIAAGTYAFAAPETLAATGAGLGTVEGLVGSSLGEGSLLGPGFSSAAELGVGTGGTPIATGAEALAGGGSASGTLAGTTGVGAAPLGGGVTSAVGAAAPVGAVPDLYAAEIGPTLGGQTLDTTLASQSVLQPAQIAQTPQIAGEAVSSGLTPATQTASQSTLGQLGVQEAGLNAPAPGTLASTSTVASDASNTALNEAVAQSAQGGNAQLAQAAQSSLGTPAVTQAAAPAAQAAETTGAQAATQTGAQAGTQAAQTSLAGYPAANVPVPPEPLAGTSAIRAATEAAAATDVANTAGAAGAEGFGSQALNYLTKNPSLLLGGLGLAANMLRGQQQPKFQSPYSQAAENMTAQGQQLSSYLTTGTLPPGVQAQMNAAQDAAIATVRSQHAARGTSGSSMEAQDLQRINETIVSQGAAIATNLLNAGINEQQMAAGIYNNLMNASIAQQKQMSDAISGFTNALAYGAARNPTPV